MKITFLGGGNMATALIGGLLNKGFMADDMVVIEINEENHKHLRRRYGVSCVAAPTPEALSCDVLLLAVKPQQLRGACAPLAPMLHEQLVISIAAGIRLSDLSRWLGGYERMVRAMPNTPALVGAGMTGCCATAAVDEAGRELADKLLQCVGATVWVEREAQMDAVTAISGSGPAYVFLFIEALQQAALELGLSAEQGRQLAVATVQGAGALAAASTEDVSVLRERVTSKGGTTAAALEVMQAQAVPAGIVAGCHAAAARGAELGRLLGAE